MKCRKTLRIFWGVVSEKITEKGGLSLSGGSVHDGFGSFDGFGGSGERPCPRFSSYKNTAQWRNHGGFDGFGGFGGHGDFSHDGYPLKLNPPFPWSWFLASQKLFLFSEVIFWDPLLESPSWWTFRIFFFSARGRGEGGSPRRREGGGVNFYWKSQEGGGGFSGGGGPEGPGGCPAPNWEFFFWGGGEPKYFVSGPKCPPRL